MEEGVDEERRERRRDRVGVGGGGGGGGGRGGGGGGGGEEGPRFARASGEEGSQGAVDRHRSRQQRLPEGVDIDCGGLGDFFFYFLF